MNPRQTASLPVNVEELLRHHTVESERIEYKAGWNPDPILRTLCAFANDFANLGGGYIVIGQNCNDAGKPIFPPQGIPDEQLDKIQLDLTEGRATGISKILKSMAANGSRTPEFVTDEDRSHFIIRLPIHEQAKPTPQVTPHVTPHVTPQVTPQVQKLLVACKGDLFSREELQTKIEIKDRKHFRIDYLQTAITLGLIEMTMPDKPNSSNQRYRLTELGQTWLNAQDDPKK